MRCLPPPRASQSRLKNRNYPSLEAFKHDVNSIFENAMYYNEDGSQIWEDAKTMQVSWGGALEMMPDVR